MKQLHTPAAFLALLLTLPMAARAQSVGIGTTTPNAKAALDISATDKGLLIPRLDSATRTGIGTPPDGLMVFQTDGRKGFWYAMSNVWLYIPDKTKSGDNLGNHSAQQDLSLNDHELRPRGATDTNHGLGWYGTSASAKNWLGQSIDGPVLYGYASGVLGTNTDGTRRSALTWTNDSRVGIGLAAPALSLDVATALGLRNAAAWDHLYFNHDGSTAFVNAGGAETGLALRVGTGSTGTYGGQPYTEVMRLQPNGRVGIGTTNPQQALDVNGTASATNFAYSTAQTRYLTLPVGAFVPATPEVYDASITIGNSTGTPLITNLARGTVGQPGYLVAPVQLPQGAVITSLTLIAFDNDGTSVAPQVLLGAIFPAATGANIQVAYVEQTELTAESANWQTVTKTTSHIVRNDLYSYNLRIRLGQNSSGTLFMAARIGYTVAQPD